MEKQQQIEMAQKPHPLIHLDATLSKSLHTLFNPYLPTSLLLLLELSADFRLSFPLFAALLLSSPSLLPFLSPLLLGLLLDLALIGLIKITFRRRRPSYNPAMIAAVSADQYSFPSGHASRVAFVATVVVLCAEVEGAVWGVYVWAVVTAVSRVLLGRHFVFDVLVGVCVGVGEGVFAARFLRFEDHFSMLLYQKATQGKIAVE